MGDDRAGVPRALDEGDRRVTPGKRLPMVSFRADDEVLAALEELEAAVGSDDQV